MLQKHYCPPIDASLFSAIALDYDLLNNVSLNELCATLDTLRESALKDENEAFDPSGTSGIQDEASSSESSERAQSWHGDAASSATEETELTGSSKGLESIDLAGNEDVGVADSEAARHEAEVEKLPPEDKVRILKEMFPDAKDFDIRYTLKKTQNEFGKSVEELLNHAFLDGGELDEGMSHRKKGVEAFTEPAIHGRGRRGRKKQRKLLRRTSSTPASNAEDSTDNSASRSRWDRAKEDIDFIVQRTHVPQQAITSIYHKNGASLPATIAAMCASTVQEASPNPYFIEASPSTLDSHTAELAVDFPYLPYSQLAALVALTHPSTASAHELARAFSSSPDSNPTKILPQYLPRPPSPPPTSTLPSASPSLAVPQSTTAALAIARSSAFTQAQSAYRRSNSSNLMGGAAAYYSSVGRDASTALRRHEAAAADALVTTQSRPGEVDLHGVTVKDAVSIARAKVESWWEREGREWARQGKVRGSSLRVITGAGRHSEGGRGKLGPAVGGMLVREGWKVEIGDGVIEVVGRVRK